MVDRAADALRSIPPVRYPLECRGGPLISLVEYPLPWPYTRRCQAGHCVPLHGVFPNFLYGASTVHVRTPL